MAGPWKRRPSAAPQSVDRVYKCVPCGHVWRVRGHETFPLVNGRPFWQPLSYRGDWCPYCRELGERASLRDFPCPTCRADEGLPCERHGEVVAWFHPERGATPKRAQRFFYRSAHTRWPRRKRGERLHKSYQKIENRRERHKVKQELR